MRSNLIQFEVRIIGLLTRDQISYLTPSCVDINQEDLALNAFVTKWMIQFQISQKNVHIVERKVTIEAIVRTNKLNIKFNSSLIINFLIFLSMYLFIHNTLRIFIFFFYVFIHSIQT